MSTTDILWFLIIGLIAGFLAGQTVRGRGYGLVGNIIVGVVGALIGGYLFSALRLPGLNGTLGAILTATLGAIVLLLLLGALRKA